MSDDPDSKTEEPTSKKLEEALKKGQVVDSAEVKTWFGFLMATFIIIGWAPIMAKGLMDLLSGHLASMHSIQTDGIGLIEWAGHLMGTVGLYLIVPLGMTMLSAFIAARVQHPFVFSTDKMKFDFPKLSPLKGAKKLAPTKMLVELVKTLAKVAIVAGVVFALAIPVLDILDVVLFWSMMETLEYTHQMTAILFIAVLIIVTLVAVFDFIYQHHKHIKGLRMTKQEIKDERKQSDGDPKIKGKLRQIRFERAQQRMMASVPEADVIITNPTHYAVALQYIHGQMDVPKLVAKGVDHVALKIREVAAEHNVPIMENAPLARALYASVDIDEEIPDDHYKAVAEIIGIVMKMGKNKIRVAS